MITGDAIVIGITTTAAAISVITTLVKVSRWSSKIEGQYEKMDVKLTTIVSGHNKRITEIEEECREKKRYCPWSALLEHLDRTMNGRSKE